MYGTSDRMQSSVSKYYDFGLYDDICSTLLKCPLLERTCGEYSGIISATLQSLLIPGKGCNIHNTPLR